MKAEIRLTGDDDEQVQLTGWGTNTDEIRIWILHTLIEFGVYLEAKKERKAKDTQSPPV